VSGSRTPTKSKSAPPNVCDVSKSTTATTTVTAARRYLPSTSNRSELFSLQFEPGAIVSDACASYSTLEGLNVALHPFLHSITQNTDFFSHYRLNLYNKKCPFWSEENGMCGNIACAVNTLENEDDIPLVWRAHELGKLEGPTAKHPGREQQREKPERPLQGSLGENVGESCVVEYDDECDERDYCIPEDERASSKGDYVSLVGNPERFTGYAGVGSQQVWEAIYRENCFSKPSSNEESSAPFAQFGGFPPLQQQAAQDLRSAIQSQGLQHSVQSAIAHNTASPFSPDPVEFEDECLEKRVFYRVISGMHASISTHICWEYLNQTTGEWAPNLACYESRLHTHPDRISNLYFNYALILRAVGKIKQHIKDYSFCTADPEQDKLTRSMVLKLADRIPSGPEIFDETIMFQDPSAADLKEDFRNRFRNVSRIMDCVGCDKCRLWGKLQTAGYGTALKVLFEFDEKDSSNDPPLRRTELVALINTMDRLSHSLNAIKEFRRLIDVRDNGQSPAVPEPEPSVLDEEEEAKFEKRKNVTAEEQTIMDVFWEEWNSVWGAYAYVLKSWLAFPAKAFNICTLEVDRLWNWWLGLPVQPRTWEFSFPRREEL
jgi:ERO1-like protein beta